MTKPESPGSQITIIVDRKPVHLSEPPAPEMRSGTRLRSPPTATCSWTARTVTMYSLRAASPSQPD